MNCPDCKTIQLTEQIIDMNKAKDLFEVVFKCSKCNTVFFGTMYRDLDQATGIIDCEKCEEKKDAL